MDEGTRQQVTWTIILAVVLSVVVLAAYRRAEVDMLLADIATGPPAERVEAVRRLVHKQKLMEALEDEPRWVQDRAVSAATLIGTEETMFQLVAAKSVVDAPVQAEIDTYLTHVGASSIGPLVMALQDKDAAVRGGAGGPLKTIGAPAVASLMPLIDVYDDAVRGLVSSTLGGIGEPAIKPLLRVMQQEEPGPDQGPAAFRRAKSAAEAAFKAMGEPAMKPMIEDLLPHENPEVRLAATGVLGAVAAALEEDGGVPAVRPLIERLTEDDAWAVRRKAASALGGLGEVAVDEGAVQPLIGRLKDGRPEVRAAAAQALGALGDPAAAQPLATLLLTNRRGATAEIAEALVKIGQPAIAPLTPALDHPEAAVRLVAAETIATIGTSDAVLPLGKALTDPEVKVREAAADALRNLADRRVLHQLIAALGDSESRVYYAARDALARMGEPAIPALLGALGSANTRVAYMAEQALARIGGPAVEPLIQWLQSGSPGARQWSGIALGAIGEAAVEPAAELLLSSGAGAEARAAAARALGATGSHSATEPLINAVKSSAAPTQVRQQAVRALGEIGDERATSTLVEALEDPAREVRATAMDVLKDWRLGDVDEKLREMLASEREAAVRRAAIVLAKHSLAASGELMRAVGAVEERVAAGSEKVRSALESIVTDSSAPDTLRREAIEGLAFVGDEESLDALAPLLSIDSQFAETAAKTVGGIGERTIAPTERGEEVKVGQAAELLLDVFDAAESRQLRLVAGSGLALMGAQPVQPLLERMKSGPEERKRWLAAILGAIGKPATFPVLDARGKAEDEKLRNWHAVTLVMIGDARAMDLIEQLPKDQKPDPKNVRASREIYSDLQKLL
ncbi:MAG: HEAT repeat domain-containing protein [Armatimonadota bacterium]|nr:HEAT repeat domain-containing protein [Armatimonadota bacterium]